MPSPGIEYGIETTVPSPDEPLRLDECKTHLRVYNPDEDAYIDRVLLPGARERIEQLTGRTLMTSTLRLSLPRFPCGNLPIWLPMPPVQSVTSIEYAQDDGSFAEMDSATYHLDAVNHRIWLETGNEWPTPAYRTAEHNVRVTYVAGYGANREDVPATLRNAILVWMGFNYGHRGDELRSSPAPERVRDLITPYLVGDDFDQYGQLRAE